MVLVEPQKSDKSYLKPGLVKDKGIRVVTPIEEMREEEQEYEGEKQMKVVGKVQCQIAGSPIVTWSMNNTCRNSLISVFGKDTKDWKKPIQILVVPIAGKDSIIVDEVGTKELNKGRGNTLL